MERNTWSYNIQAYTKKYMFDAKIKLGQWLIPGDIFNVTLWNAIITKRVLYQVQKCCTWQSCDTILMSHESCDKHKSNFLTIDLENDLRWYQIILNDSILKIFMILRHFWIFLLVISKNKFDIYFLVHTPGQLSVSPSLRISRI